MRMRHRLCFVSVELPSIELAYPCLWKEKQNHLWKVNASIQTHAKCSLYVWVCAFLAFS